MNKIVFAALAASLAAAGPAAAQEELTAPGPEGALTGTLVRPAEGQPVVLIVPGSGPTDRDGNNPAGIAAAPYRLLAEGLAARGIGSLRIDKRGMFASKAATADPNDATIAAYAGDVAAWIESAREATGRQCVWLLGHSEGGLVALAAAQQPEHMCGLILVAAPGRPMSRIIRAQLEANPANAPLLEPAMAALDKLERGERVDVTGMHPALQGLFAPPVQGFLIDMFAYDPAALAAKVALPTLIVQGGKDLQIGRDSGDALHAAQPAAEYVVVPAMNHVLKDIEADGPQANFAAYADPSLPIAPELVDAIAGFVSAPDPPATVE
jgi:pimeloyl-ACP methyl ester carboxylesterase